MLNVECLLPSFVFSFRLPALRRTGCGLKEIPMRTLLLMVIGICLSTVSVLAGTQMIYATHGEPFEMTGTVLGYDGGNCVPEKFTYALDSVDHRNKVWLCATGRTEVALRRAMIDRGFYCIDGTLHQGADRPYVEVESVHHFY